MRKQDHTIGFEMNPEVLAIFHGAHAYVSASWYDTKQAASTWNYQAVHARGILRFLDDAALYDLLVKLTAHFEKNPDSPAQVKHMSEDYIRSNMKAIIAFEIEVTDLQHVFKLSQNRNKESFDNIAIQLQHGDTDAKKIANEMLQRKEQIFKS
jgi:transcriptional regulator